MFVREKLKSGNEFKIICHKGKITQVSLDVYEIA